MLRRLLTAGVLACGPAFAQSLPTRPASAPSPRVAALLAELPLERKVGQLFMAWTLSREPESSSKLRELESLVEQGRLGGVILSLGSCEQARTLIERFQTKAPLPLLMAGDFESSVAFRLSDATPLGNAMQVGATGQTRLAYLAGCVTGSEARALGFHWAFAPILDVNVNPANPIINVRSFGESPALVSALGIAFANGLTDNGVLACGKHFPGHGDTATDSHLELPLVSGDRARLDRVELEPFRRAIAAGIPSLMTAHIAVPALTGEPGLPATLSPKVLTDLLRKELGFQGIVTTDALDMGGVKKAFPPGEVAVRALLAGADLLLMSPEPVVAQDAIVAAVRSGRLPAARLDDAVARILAAKERVGLLAGPVVLRPDWRNALQLPRAKEIGVEIARRAVTLVRDELGLVPFAKGMLGKDTVLVELHDDASGEPTPVWLGTKELRRHELWARSDPAEVAAAAHALAAAPFAIVALHVRVKSFSGSIGVPPALSPVVAALAAHPRALAVSFGNPYLVRDFPKASTYLCAYESSTASMAAVAQALAGEIPITGRLPVGIPGIAPAGAGLSVHPAGAIAFSSPLAEGMESSMTMRVRTLLTKAVEEKVFPGAVAVVVRNGRFVSEVAVGRETYDAGSPAVTAGTVYDLASLTKVCATTPLCLRLVAQGKLTLDRKVSELVPDFTGGGKELVTIRHLLTHCAGLPAYVKFFEQGLTGRERIQHAAATTPLEYAPGTKSVYSDLGMILLMACLEKVGGAPFETQVADEVLFPLGMRGACFATTGTPIAAAPTEVCPWRKRLVQGEAHDENAFAMGGISGHAGLFGTAQDVARMGDALLSGGKGWLPRPLLRDALRRQELVPASSRALGWDMFEPGKSGGDLLAPDAFGHTGFTGTSIWCDPRRDLVIVLLTNRVHPTRDNKKLDAVRRALCDLVSLACETK